MAINQQVVIALWGATFEAMPLTSLVTELRREGFQVHIVGLNERPTKGIDGIIIAPDLTLEYLLAHPKALSCVIVPCNTAGGKLLKTDPRLRTFFAQAVAQQAAFVLGTLTQAEIIAAGLSQVAEEKMLVYPQAREQIIPFARDLAALLWRR